MTRTPTAQDEHQAATAGCTQKDRLLARLQEWPGVWVSMPELAKAMSPSGNGVGVCVSRRIYDLRRAGHKIEQEDYTENGVRHSAYRLLTPELAAEPFQSEIVNPKS